MRESVTAYIALGANLGDPVAGVRKAMDDLAALDGIALQQRSSRTAARHSRPAGGITSMPLSKFQPA